MKMYRIILLFVTGVMLCSCAYLQSVSKQNDLELIQQSDPRQHNLKHLIERDTYTVYGRLLRDTSKDSQHSIAVAALSNRYQQNEIVDVNHLGKINSYYGLNLPQGKYKLLVLEDKNDDKHYDQSEIIAEHHLALNPKNYPDKVARTIDINLSSSIVTSKQYLDIPVVDIPELKQSISFPKGTIRSLDDPIFSTDMSSLGMYDPAAFVERAPMMFYAMEEDTIYKVPVIFVHGIGGSVKEFKSIIDRLDRDRYKPWFFYYPSGMDLNQMAKMFYDIYLSGKLIKKGYYPTIIISHSMGGLVVREALNLYQGNELETNIKLFISIASPFGGLTSAKKGVEQAPLVLPSWRNLTPDGMFIKDLFRNRLPPTTEHHLFYAYRETGDSNDSDGVVPIPSQLTKSALSQITGQYGFKTGHADILRDVAATEKLLELITQVKSNFTEEHLRYLDMGGFKVKLNQSYNKYEKYIIHNMGFYLKALANGEITPLPINESFLATVRKGSKPVGPFGTAWLKFRKDYPALVVHKAE